jgi:hypothetical protein
MFKTAHRRRLAVVCVGGGDRKLAVVGNDSAGSSNRENARLQVLLPPRPCLSAPVCLALCLPVCRKAVDDWYAYPMMDVRRKRQVINQAGPACPSRTAARPGCPPNSFTRYPPSRSHVSGCSDTSPNF